MTHPMPLSTSVDLRESTLFISLRSPFARRVRVGFLENEIPFSEKTFDVFKPTSELYEANPLGRVPTLILKDGRKLTESHVILQCLYEGIESPYFPQVLKVKILYEGAISAGISEKCIDYYLEQLRPEAHRDPALQIEIDQAVSHSLEHLEKCLATSSFVVGNRLTQADFDWGVSLAYLELRYPASRWQERYPKAAAFFSKLDQRPSFQKTRPPAA
jgi:glutathione S-transferase